MKSKKKSTSKPSKSLKAAKEHVYHLDRVSVLLASCLIVIAAIAFFRWSAPSKIRVTSDPSITSYMSPSPGPTSTAYPRVESKEFQGLGFSLYISGYYKAPTIDENGITHWDAKFPWYATDTKDMLLMESSRTPYPDTKYREKASLPIISDDPRAPERGDMLMAKEEKVMSNGVERSIKSFDCTKESCRYYVTQFTVGNRHYRILGNGSKPEFKNRFKEIVESIEID